MKESEELFSHLEDLPTLEHTSDNIFVGWHTYEKCEYAYSRIYKKHWNWSDGKTSKEFVEKNKRRNDEESKSGYKDWSVVC